MTTPDWGAPQAHPEPAGQANESAAVSPGWYADPWGITAWRWWDGGGWTVHVAGLVGKKPRLPAWLSVPVLVCGVVVVIGIVLLAVFAPIAVALGLVPLVVVGPVLAWLDRVEPEPRSARVHALLWGATVAVLVSGIVNTIVDVAAGSTVAAVVSAPVIEEMMKAIGIAYAVRRKELDGVMDGIVYTGWTALGFAVVEDFLYFADASSGGVLIQVFILRALLTPFAHPLFTAWTGLAIGLAASKGKPIFPAMLWGLGLAIASHAAWNGSLSLADGDDGTPVLLGSVVLFVALFVAGSAMLISARRKEQRRFVELVPWLAERYHMAPAEVAVFSDWKSMHTKRRALPRPRRRYFDGVHGALARLAHYHDQPGLTDPTNEAVLAARLHDARYADRQ